MDMDSPFSCGGWSMHQPVDWDYTEFLTDMFAPTTAGNTMQQPQQQPQQIQPQQQQTAMATMNSMAPPAPTTYATFNHTWASSMHQPVDWELPALISAPAQPAHLLQVAPDVHALQQAQPAANILPLQIPAIAIAPSQQQQLQLQLPASSSGKPPATATATSQLAKDRGNGTGSGVTSAGSLGPDVSGVKRDRCVRRIKSTALRPQQQQMLDLQKKLDALVAEHAIVEAENERLKTRLRVLEAVLPVRQQQALWAQSKTAAERAAERCAPPDPVLANLLDMALAPSAPSSCATSSPARQEGTPAAAAAAAGTPATGCAAWCGLSGGGAAAADGIATAAIADNSLAMTAAAMAAAAASSPALALVPAEPAPCASSSCGAASTSTATTSGNTNAVNPPALRNHHHNNNNSNQHNGNHFSGQQFARSGSLNNHNTDDAVIAGRRCCAHHNSNRTNHHINHQTHHSSSHIHHHGGGGGGGGGDCLTRGRFRGSGGGGDGGCSRERAAESPCDSQPRWLDAWRTWVREAALLLQAYDARPNDHYLTRLEEAFTKLKSEVVYLGLRHPELICNMRCVNLETGAEQEFPQDSFWALVVGGMKLDPQQVAECKSALALYRERMAVVLAERRKLASQMSTCLTALQLEEADGRAAPGSRRREELSLEAEEAASALEANVAVEGHTTSLARDLLGSKLFSRMQCARASVLSYPYFPDALAIITAAVGDHDTTGTAAAPPPPQSTSPPSLQQQ